MTLLISRARTSCFLYHDSQTIQMQFHLFLAWNWGHIFSYNYCFVLLPVYSVTCPLTLDSESHDSHFNSHNIAQRPLKKESYWLNHQAQTFRSRIECIWLILLFFPSPSLIVHNSFPLFLCREVGSWVTVPFSSILAPEVTWTWKKGEYFHATLGGLL